VNLVLVVGILLVIGFFGGIIARKVKLPTISGYIIIGMFLSLFHVIPRNFIEGNLSIIIEVSLGMIGYLVGGTLNYGMLKKFGKQIVIITMTQLMGAWILVSIFVFFLTPFLLKANQFHPAYFQSLLPSAIIIGAISCATAPAATIAIIRECKANGPLTNTLLAVIALDDGLCVIAFALGLNIAKIISSGIAGLNFISWFKALLIPLINISGSASLGAVLGMTIIYFISFADNKKRLLVLITGIIMLCIGLAKVLQVSNILANMVMGFVVTNRIKPNEDAFEVIDDVDEVIFAMFFTLAGAQFDLGVIKEAGILSVLIIFGRCGGKYIGAWIGASISNSSALIKKYLGLGLMPKAGVTVGLALLAKQYFNSSGVGNIMLSAILTSVIINELIAPPLTKYALTKSGEVYYEQRLS